MLACGFSSVSKDTFGWYPCAAIKGDPGPCELLNATIDEDGCAELYGDDWPLMPWFGVAIDEDGEARGTVPTGGDRRGDETEGWLGVLGREGCFIAERSGGGGRGM